MSKILEERASEEVIKRDEVIEVLQKELDRVEDEKKQLVVEVADLRVARQTVKDLKIQVGTLEKDVAARRLLRNLPLPDCRK